MLNSVSTQGLLLFVSTDFLRKYFEPDKIYILKINLKNVTLNRNQENLNKLKTTDSELSNLFMKVNCKRNTSNAPRSPKVVFCFQPEPRTSI